MKVFFIKITSISLLFFLFLGTLQPSPVLAGCSSAALCDAPAGECRQTCNGGQTCRVSNGGWQTQCVQTSTCICNKGDGTTGACTTNINGSQCGTAPYWGTCNCVTSTSCTDPTFTCQETYWEWCCSPGTSNPCGDGDIDAGETCSNCPQDVGSCPPACGDGACNGGESCGSCSSDCGACPSGGGTPPPPTCPNNTCGPGENCSNCAADCGVCVNNCGNGVCGAGETIATCPSDCLTCGNGTCGAGENCSNCASDCGACDTAFCGDSACNAFETCGTCAGDCGACPTDVAWWQAQNAPAYAAQNNGAAINSMVPATCTAPACTRALLITDAAQTALSDGFAITGGGAIVSNGYSTERQPNMEVITTNLTKFRESYDFFYREYSLGNSPVDDFSGNAGNATKPIVDPAGGRDAYFHNSASNGTFTIQERWQVLADEQLVILISGDMVITNPSGFDDLITVEEGGSLVFIVSGNITIDETVGNSSVANDAPNIEGVFIADGTITVESTGDTSTEKRFIGAGSFVGWTAIDLNRDLGAANNQNTPAEFFTFRPDFVQNVPEHLARPHYVWQETN